MFCGVGTLSWNLECAQVPFCRGVRIVPYSACIADVSHGSMEGKGFLFFVDTCNRVIFTFVREFYLKFYSLELGLHHYLLGTHFGMFS